MKLLTIMNGLLLGVAVTLQNQKRGRILVLSFTLVMAHPLSGDAVARRRGLACELQLNPFSCWAVEAQKCYDTRPGTEIFWGFLINFFSSLDNPPPPRQPPSTFITHTHTHSQTACSGSLTEQRPRVSGSEHVVCHINSSRLG